MRIWLLVAAAVLVVAGVMLYAVPAGVIAAGFAVGAIAWFSE